jgi:hypothetical protein
MEIEPITPPVTPEKERDRSTTIISKYAFGLSTPPVTPEKDKGSKIRSISFPETLIQPSTPAATLEKAHSRSAPTLGSSSEHTCEPAAPENENSSSVKTPETTSELLTPPTTPEKEAEILISSTPVSTETAPGSIFCCSECTTFITARSDTRRFHDFSLYVADGNIEPLPSYTRFLAHFINYMIIVLPTLSRSVGSARYFACFTQSKEYYEMDATFLDLYQETKDVKCALRLWFTCQAHAQGFQLLRIEDRVEEHEGWGLREKKASLRERARMKRDVLVRKICYYDRESEKQKLK